MTRDFVLVTLVNLLVMTGDYQFFVTTALYAMRLFEAHLSEAGAISGLFVLGCFIGRFVTGHIITIYGVRRTLLGGLLLLTASVLMIFGATNIALFTLERFFFGFAIGAVSTATSTLVAYCLPHTVQGFGVSIFSLSTALALALGPFIGLTLTSVFGSWAVNILVLILIASSLLLAPFIRTNPALKRSQLPFWALDNYIDRKALKVALVAFIVPIGYGCITAYLAAMCEERGMGNAAGYFFLTVAIVTIISRPFCGRLFDRVGENIVIYPAIVLAALTLFIITRADAAWMIVAAGVLHGLGLSNFQSSGQALVLKLVDSSRYAQAT